MSGRSTLSQWKGVWASHWSNWSKNKTKHESSLGWTIYQVLAEKTEHISHVFCIFITNHLLLLTREAWKRSCVHYFFKRCFFFFMFPTSVCSLSFCIKKREKKRGTWPWFVSLTSSGEKKKLESHWTAGLREPRMLF